MQLICAFNFAYAKSRFSHDMAHCFAAEEDEAVTAVKRSSSVPEGLVNNNGELLKSYSHMSGL